MVLFMHDALVIWIALESPVLEALAQLLPEQKCCIKGPIQGLLQLEEHT